MRFYKNIDKEEFADLFSQSGSGDDDEADDIDYSVRSHDRVKEFIDLVPKDIETKKEKINVKVNRKGELIESIDVECQCGNTVRLVIDYDED